MYRVAKSEGGRETRATLVVARDRPVGFGAPWAKYSTPIRGYWQCGSGTHPGGGIMGASGRLAAMRILKAGNRADSTDVNCEDDH